MDNYHDEAITLAWPDQTARGDEKWMHLLKNAKIIKNLNFKVGHAAILLIERKTGDVFYYDFGRYVCPRGTGRARSINFDPNLELKTKAIWKNNRLDNLKNILNELIQISDFTHGEGILYCSLAHDISFKKAKSYADELVDIGPISYGAFARNNSNCSRFVAKVLAKGLHFRDFRKLKLLLPNSLKPSPISNVIYSNKKYNVYTYENDILRNYIIHPRKGLIHLIKQMLHSFKSKSSAILPKDGNTGELIRPLMNSILPKNAQWLGGIGEGAWMHLSEKEQHYYISRFNKNGEKIYEVLTKNNQNINLEEKYSFTYDFNVNKHVLNQCGKEIIFSTLKIIYVKNKNNKDGIENTKIENSHR